MTVYLVDCVVSIKLEFTVHTLLQNEPTTRYHANVTSRNQSAGPNQTRVNTVCCLFKTVTTNSDSSHTEQRMDKIKCRHNLHHSSPHLIQSKDTSSGLRIRGCDSCGFSVLEISPSCKGKRRARGVITAAGGLWKRAGDFIWVMRTLRPIYTTWGSLS